jgi:hypothetical protein
VTFLLTTSQRAASAHHPKHWQTPTITSGPVFNNQANLPPPPPVRLLSQKRHLRQPSHHSQKQKLPTMPRSRR